MSKKILAIICIFVTSTLVSWNLFKPGFFSMHDDLHVMRLFEMKRCLNEGQIPCRWSPDMGAGFGQPMFNYYSATPYYTGELIKSLGFSYINTVKILMFATIALSGIAMFIFLSEIITTLPAFVGAVAYILVPFRALEIFVRGALSENFALALLPLVLYGILRLTKKKDKTSFVLLSIFSGLFLATHNITTLTSSLLILLFSVAVIFLSKNWQKSLGLLSFSAILGIGISAFFLLPVLFESNLINTNLLTSGYFDFRAHFVTLKQLFFNQSWGYGGSEFGANDDLSFAVGIIQTLAFIIAPITLYFKRKTLNSSHKLFLAIFWLLGIIYLFLTTGRSVGLWELISSLHYIQFPWRLLGIVAVCSSVVLGTIISSFDKKMQKTLAIITLFTLFFLNFRYFKFENNFKTATDDTYLSGQGFIAQQKSAIQDYRPLSMANIPENIAPKNPVVLSGLAEVKNFQKRSNYFSADVDVSFGQATVAFPISNFPNWTVYLNSSISNTPLETGKDFGEITLTFDKGLTLVQGYFENTVERTIGNLATFASLLIVLVIILTPNDKKNNQED